MSLLQGKEHAFSFNFILCRELLRRFNMPAQDIQLVEAGIATRVNTLIYVKPQWPCCLTRRQ